MPLWLQVKHAVRDEELRLVREAALATLKEHFKASQLERVFVGGPARLNALARPYLQEPDGNSAIGDALAAPSSPSPGPLLPLRRAPVLAAAPQRATAPTPRTRSRRLVRSHAYLGVRARGTIDLAR